jgi:hypothetical protein
MKVDWPSTPAIGMTHLDGDVAAGADVAVDMDKALEEDAVDEDAARVRSLLKTVCMSRAKHKQMTMMLNS